VIVVVAALKGGVGKTTTSVYLSALATGSRREVTLIDADPQASAADWVEVAEDDELAGVTVVEAPTDRMLTKALGRIDADDLAIVDTPPGNERLLAKSFEIADAVVLPTRVGGVDTPRLEMVLEMMPAATPAGIVVCSARTYTRDYQDLMAEWASDHVRVWGTVPERVAISAGPQGWLSPDGLESYRGVWRRVVRAAREG
jgi:chromosome partitioning protein